MRCAHNTHRSAHNAPAYYVMRTQYSIVLNILRPRIMRCAHNTHRSAHNAHIIRHRSIMRCTPMCIMCVYYVCVFLCGGEGGIGFVLNFEYTAY